MNIKAIENMIKNVDAQTQQIKTQNWHLERLRESMNKLKTEYTKMLEIKSELYESRQTIEKLHQEKKKLKNILDE